MLRSDERESLACVDEVGKRDSDVRIAERVFKCEVLLFLLKLLLRCPSFVGVAWAD